MGDKSDAFRHGIWNAELTVLIGKEKAELFATSHEDKDVTGNESDGYPKTEHRYMDLHNNAVGRTIGEKNSGASEDEMAYIIYHDICAAELGITQQMLSKYEKDVTLIKVDILKKIAAYFNVTTDYLLGVSDVKRDLQRQMKMNETLDEFYDLVEVYKELDSYDKEMIWSIIQTIKKTSEKREKGNGQAVRE